MFSITSAKVAPGLRRRLLKGVEIYHHHVDRLDPMLLDGLAMVGFVTNMKNPAVYLRMQRLHPPIEHLWKAGQLRDIEDRQARLAQSPRRASRRDELNIVLCKLLCKCNQAGFIGDAQKGSPHLPNADPGAALGAAQNIAGSHVGPEIGESKENCMGRCAALSHPALFVSRSQ